MIMLHRRHSGYGLDVYFFIVKNLYGLRIDIDVESVV